MRAILSELPIADDVSAALKSLCENWITKIYNIESFLL
jgi:hypothetical protein